MRPIPTFAPLPHQTPSRLRSREGAVAGPTGPAPRWDPRSSWLGSAETGASPTFAVPKKALGHVIDEVSHAAGRSRRSGR
jgi:hypothetical protein